MNDELKQAKAELAALLQEERDCEAAIIQGEKAKKRKDELRPQWNAIGEIEKAIRKVRDVQAGPIIEYGNYGRSMRVIGLTEKMIVTRRDGVSTQCTTNFRQSDGLRQGSRANDRYALRIDAPEALRLWAEWCAAKDVCDRQKAICADEISATIP